MKRWRDQVFGFACLFAGLSLPIDAVGRMLVRACAALGGLLLPELTSSGVALAFRADDAGLTQAPWSLPLWVTPPPPQLAINVPIDIRALIYLPTACFVALAVATPLASWRQNARLLGLGLLVLEPVLLGLASVPLLSFLGGTGPIRVFELGLVAHTLLQLVYRALVVPPAMAFAIPLFVWWGLLRRLSDFRTTVFEIQKA